MTNTPRWYGVSSGNGNDGVSQMFPDYYVFTSDPWELARLAVVSTFKDGAGKAWCERHLEIDGEADYTIRATIDAPPCDDTPDGEYPDLPDYMYWEDAEDGRNWSDGNGAWLIFEVFPAEVTDSDVQYDAPMYEHPLLAFGYEAFAL